MAVALTLYFIAGLLAVAWAVAVLPPLRAPAAGGLDPAALGMLRAGARGALVATLTELYAAGVVAVTAGGTLARGRAPLPAGSSELARAVYGALVVRRTLRGLLIRTPVRQALRSLAADLAEQGLVPTTASWRVARAVQIVLIVLAMVIVTRAGTLPGWLLLPAVLAVAVAVAGWWVPRRTVAGRRALTAARRALAAAPPIERSAHASPTPTSTPTQSARFHALTGTVLDGMEPVLARGARDRSFITGRLDQGDGVSAQHPGAAR